MASKDRPRSGGRQPHQPPRRRPPTDTASLSSGSYSSLRLQVGPSPVGQAKMHWRSYQTEDFARKTREVEEQIYSLENRREDHLLFSHTSNRRTNLIGYDVALLIIEYFSIHAMLLSCSLRWTWPLSWVTATGWTFLFNLDIFELAKVYTPNVYFSVQGSYTKSSLIPVPFWSQMVLWAILTIILAVSFLSIFFYLWIRRTPRYYIQMSRLRRVYLLIMQFLALPFGITLGKVFHCVSATQVVDVDNSLTCWGGAHWAYLATACIAAIAFYFLIPAYMIYRTDRQIVSLTDEKHETYLRLKEQEYKRGLDAIWYISEFYLFSSFRRAGVFYRPVMHLMKLVWAAIYGALFESMQVQGILFCSLFFFMAVVFAFVRPFRVTVFNVYLVVCYFCLGSTALMGVLRASFNAFSVATVFLLPDYTTGILALINGVWILITIGFVVFLAFRSKHLWPIMSSEDDDLSKGSTVKDATTRKYVRAVLKAKAVIEYATSMPSMFAPVHELSRQVLLVNALFREAEASGDPLQDTLWDILDELSQLHARLLPRSLFAESVKPSVRRTAAEFLSMMPQLARRLHQREYDFIMVHPVRRHILFKLYVISVFLRGSRNVRQREQVVRERATRVWQASRELDDIYYPTLYPDVEEGPSVLAVTMPVAKDMRNDDDRKELQMKALSDSLVDLKDADDQQDSHLTPPSTAQGAYANEAFEEELDIFPQQKSSDDQNLPTANKTQLKESAGPSGTTLEDNRESMRASNEESPESIGEKVKEENGESVEKSKSNGDEEKSVPTAVLVDVDDGSQNQHSPKHSPRDADVETGIHQ